MLKVNKVNLLSELTSGVPPVIFMNLSVVPYVVRRSVNKLPHTLHLCKNLVWITFMCMWYDAFFAAHIDEAVFTMSSISMVYLSIIIFTTFPVIMLLNLSLIELNDRACCATASSVASHQTQLLSPNPPITSKHNSHTMFTSQFTSCIIQYT